MRFCTWRLSGCPSVPGCGGQGKKTGGTPAVAAASTPLSSTCPAEEADDAQKVCGQRNSSSGSQVPLAFPSCQPHRNKEEKKKCTRCGWPSSVWTNEQEWYREEVCCFIRNVFSLQCPLVSQRSSEANSRLFSPFFPSTPFLSRRFLQSFHPQHSDCTHHPLPYSGKRSRNWTCPLLPTVPQTASLAGGSSSFAQACHNVHTGSTSNEKERKSHPPQKEKFGQLAPAITKFNPCPSNCRSHLHSLLAIHFPLCSTYWVFQGNVGFLLAVAGSAPRGSSSFH